MLIDVIHYSVQLKWKYEAAGIKFLNAKSTRLSHFYESLCEAEQAFFFLLNSLNNAYFKNLFVLIDTDFQKHIATQITKNCRRA